MADLENQRGSSPEGQPLLLAADRERDRELDQTQDIIACHIVKIHGEDSWVWNLRHELRRFLGGKGGHYFVIALVSLDIASIFADFVISLHICEHKHDIGFDRKGWTMADEVLDHVILAVSCLFMAELLATVFAFGFGYFKSKLHLFDAIVIIASFAVDATLRGLDQDIVSLIVIGRLWRMFKIIEEFGSEAEDSIAELHERILILQREKEDIAKENDRLQLQASRHPPANGHTS